MSRVGYKMSIEVTHGYHFSEFKAVNQKLLQYLFTIAVHKSIKSVLFEISLLADKKGFKNVAQSTPPLVAAIASAIYPLNQQ